MTLTTNTTQTLSDEGATKAGTQLYYLVHILFGFFLLETSLGDKGVKSSKNT